ncbi:11318_t:CDS:1 [Cetraspora pellucida]|uniref:11318_t:CDS:1 n=1 Tax=Cetraspora pellucida TaxID=1433469 RepID=A0ACA9PC26_9GLOM|nr:11318_t:CDS:1 [Cetraspora pellucida]
MINNHQNIWDYNDKFYEETRLKSKNYLTLLLTSSWNPEPIYWQEILLRQFSYRVYQELLLQNKNQEKLSKEKIDKIVDDAMNYWIQWFDPNPDDMWPNYLVTTKNVFNEYVNIINDNFTNIITYQFQDNKVENLKWKISIITEIYNKKSIYWAEEILHQITHRTFQTLLSTNQIILENSNNDENNQLNNQLKENQILKINKILENLKINFFDNETIDEKIDKIIEFSELIKQF